MSIGLPYKKKKWVLVLPESYHCFPNDVMSQIFLGNEVGHILPLTFSRLGIVHLVLYSFLSRLQAIVALFTCLVFLRFWSIRPAVLADFWCWAWPVAALSLDQRNSHAVAPVNRVSRSGILLGFFAVLQCLCAFWGLHCVCSLSFGPRTCTHLACNPIRLLALCSPPCAMVALV